MTPHDQMMKIRDLDISPDVRVGLCDDGRVAIFRYESNGNVEIDESALCAALAQHGIPAVEFDWWSPNCGDFQPDDDGDMYLVEYGRPILNQEAIQRGSRYNCEIIGDLSSGYWWYVSEKDISVFQDTSTGVCFYAWNGRVEDHDSAEKSAEYLTIDEAIEAAIRIWNEGCDDEA